jgi:Fe-S-cluster containining protein
MIKLINQLKDYFDPPQSGTVEFQYYIRKGACHGCGECCSGIYLVHGEKPITTIAEFNQLQPRHQDYQHFVPIEENDTGVMFRCKHLQEDKTCGIYEDRPLFCKKYPTEATLIYGGNLAERCGYNFKAKKHFSELLDKAAKKRSLKPGKLLNDVTPEPSS